MFNIAEFFDQIPDEYKKYLIYIPWFIGSFLVTLLLTPIVGAIAKKLKVYDLPPLARAVTKRFLNKDDDPNRHIHTKPIPFLGGLAVLIPLLLLLIFNAPAHPIFVPIIIGLVIIIISGILDDAFNLPAIIQLIAQILAASIIAFSVINLEFVNNPFGGIIDLNLFDLSFNFLGIPAEFIFPGDLLLILWIGVCMNSVKWVAGSDALMESNVFFTFIFLFVLSLRTLSWEVAQISIITAGGLAGFIVYNFPPAKIFTGATGKTAYGYIIAVLSILNGAKIATTIMILMLPLFDFVFTVVRRIIQHKPKNPLEVLRINDAQHLHHQLLKYGLSKKQVLLVEVGFVLTFGSIAVLTTGAIKLFALFAAGAISILFIFILYMKVSKKKIEDPEKKEEEKESDKKNKPKDPDEPSPEAKYSY